MVKKAGGERGSNTRLNSARLSVKEGGGKVFSSFSSHPSHDARVAQVSSRGQNKIEDDERRHAEVSRKDALHFKERYKAYLFIHAQTPVPR